MKTKTKVNVATKILMVSVCILLAIVVFLGASGTSYAKTRDTQLHTNELSEMSSTSPVDTVAEECREYTKSTLSSRTNDLNNVFDYIPKSVFTRPEGGWYYFVGEKYGFALKSSPITDELFTREGIPMIASEGIVFECEFINDRATNTASYEITATTNLFFNMYADVDRVNKKITDLRYYTNHNASNGKFGDKYYLSNIVIATEMNTIGEQNENFVGADGYKIQEDNSYYYDNIVADYSLRTDTHADFSDAVPFVITSIVDAVCFEGIPVTGILDAVLGFQKFEYLENKGYFNNYLNYQGQVASKLQKKSAVKSAAGAYLGAKHENEGRFKLSYKYDNKLHDIQDMQFGVKVWFDVYENTNAILGSSMVKVANGDNEGNTASFYNCGRYNNYNVYNTSDEFSIDVDFDVVNDMIIGENEPYVFYNNNGFINLSFTPKHTRKYDFVTGVGNQVLINNVAMDSAVLQKNTTYNVRLMFDYRVNSHATLFIEDNAEMQLNQPQTLYNGLSYCDISFDNDCADMIKAINANTACKLYIVDDLGNILTSASGSEINKFWRSGEKYRVFVENSGTAIANFSLQNIAEVEVGSENTANFDEVKLYRFSPIARNYYTLSATGVFRLYDQNYNELASSGKILLEKQKYYIEIEGKASGTVSFNSVIDSNSATVGSAIAANTDIDEVFSVNINNPCTYRLLNNCDVYNASWEEIYNNVDDFYIGVAGKYYIINSTRSSSFKIEYGVENLYLSSDIIINNPKACAYYINTDAQKYIAVEMMTSGYFIMDENYSTIIEDHGYYLANGIGYLIVGANQGAFTVTEYLLEITITTNNDGDIHSQNVSYRNNYSLGVPTKENYDFNGWKYQGQHITDNEGHSLDSLLIDEDFAAIPSWVARNAYVYFEDGGTTKWWTGAGFGSEADKHTVHVSVENFWVNFKDSFRENEYGKKQGNYLGEINVIWLAEERTYKLELEWKLEKYILNFDFANDKENISICYTYGTCNSQLEALNELKKDNYSFSGWILRVGNGKVLSEGFFTGEYKTYDFTLEIASSSTITVSIDANWIANVYKIYFNSAGGQRVEPMEINYGGTVQDLPTTSREHYNFACWMYNGVAFNNGFMYNVSGDITIFADWVPLPYTITFSFYGGGQAHVAEVYTIESETFNLPMPTTSLYGYKFRCWSLNNSDIYEIRKGTFGDIRLIAQWIGDYGTARYSNYGVNSTNYPSQIAIVDLSYYSLSTIYVGSDIEEVSFYGVPNRVMSDTQIVFAARTTSIIIRLRDISGYGLSNNSFLYLPNSTINVTIEMYGVVNITGGERNNADNGEVGKMSAGIDMYNSSVKIIGNGTAVVEGGKGVWGGVNGADGVVCKSLVIGHVDFTSVGGNGAKEIITLAGASAGKAAEGKDGGNGSRGNDGGTGGIGGSGVNVSINVTVLAGAKVVLKGGKGGDGAIGGAGGKGGDGGDGRPGKFLVAATPGGDGGNGAQGGTGGTGGIGGKACNNSINNYGNLELINGNGGNGGNGGAGGKGGNGGAGASKWNSANRQPPGNGGAGGAGGIKGAGGAGASFKPTVIGTEATFIAGATGAAGTNGSVGANGNRGAI